MPPDCSRALKKSFLYDRKKGSGKFSFLLPFLYFEGC